MSGFEGSYLGAVDKISPLAIMECKVCWTPYDPAAGDEARQIDPGTSFAALPEDWSCPNCSAPAAQFLVREDPGAPQTQETVQLNAVTQRLVADFTGIWHGSMRDVPIVNETLRVEAVGFQMYEGRPLGVLISPWFMNLIQLPGADDDWSGLRAGEKEIVEFPSGHYEFIHNKRERTGGYKACSLFSPMGGFSAQSEAVDVAKAVMQALFSREHRAETDRAGDIRAAREAELGQHKGHREPVPEEHLGGRTPSRRAVIGAGLMVKRCSMPHA